MGLISDRTKKVKTLMVLTVRFEIPAYRTVDHFVDITSCVFQGSARASTNVIIDCQLSTSISTLLLYSL